MTGVSNVTFDEIEVGRTVSISRPVTETEVQAMVLLSGDTESWDVGPDSSKGRDSATAQAVGAEAILSMLLNRRLPGPGTRILAQDLRFEGVIGLGAEVTASVTAREKRTDDAIVVFDCRVAQGGQALVAGSVTVKAPTRRIAYDEVATTPLILRHNDAFTKLLRRCEGLAPVSCAVIATTSTRQGRSSLLIHLIQKAARACIKRAITVISIRPAISFSSVGAMNKSKSAVIALSWVKSKPCFSGTTACVRQFAR